MSPKLALHRRLAAVEMFATARGSAGGLVCCVFWLEIIVGVAVLSFVCLRDSGSCV